MGGGLGRESFFLASSQPSRAHVKALEEISDVYLDTFPFSGSISVIDPLQLGIPVVVWEGKTPRSRMASALLREIGITDLIAQDEERYIRISVKLATDPAYRAHVSAKMTSAMSRTPRFLDPKAYGRDLGKVLEATLSVMSHPSRALAPAS